MHDLFMLVQESAMARSVAAQESTACARCTPTRHTASAGAFRACDDTVSNA